MIVVVCKNIPHTTNHSPWNLIIFLPEIFGDERTRLLYESRQKMEWDNQARERGAEKNAMLTVAKNLIRRNRSIDEIIEDTGLTCEEIEGLQS